MTTQKRGRGWLLYLALLLPLMMGGKTTYVGVELPVTYIGNVHANNLDPATEYHAPCSDVVDTKATTLASANCYVPVGYTLLLQQFSLVAVNSLTAANNEQCEVIIETSSTGSAATGTDITSSLIKTGESHTNAAGTCLSATAVIIDERGEGCDRNIDPTDANATVTGGGWWRINFNEPAGAETCEDQRGFDYFVKGLLIEGA